MGYFITIRRPLLKVNVLLAVLEKKNDKVHGGILVYEIPDVPQLYIYALLITQQKIQYLPIILFFSFFFFLIFKNFLLWNITCKYSLNYYI